MNPVALLVGQFVVVTVGVIAAWIVATRRLPAPWSAIGWGALTFPLSQVARYIVLIPVTLGLGAVLGATSPVMTTVGIVLAVLTSGIFEEGARWIVMRYWAKGVRTWPTGVAFGLGHGGIEALLLIGMNAINGVVLFSTAEVARGAVAQSAPDQLPTLDAQIAAFEGITLGVAGLGVWERALAICFHVMCSLIVMQAVRTRRLPLLLLAMAAHCGFNAIAVGLSQGASPLVVELLLTLCMLPVLWVALRGPLSRARLDGRPSDVPTG